MLTGKRRVLQSRSNRHLMGAAKEYLSAHAEVLVTAPSHSAGEELAQRMSQAAGIHRLTLVQLASDLSRASMAAMGLAPVTMLGLEALAARVVHAALAEGELAYFKPVAALPGFARALARTIGELRMARVEASALAETGAAGEDLAKLLARYNAELESGRLADMARIFELATRAAGEPGCRWIGLPLLSLDVPLTTKAQRELFESVASRAPSVLTCVLDESGGSDPEPVSELEHLKAYLFSATPPAASRDGALELFSAPGEGLEAVEIARRILKLARDGTPFDRVAILLRSPERYQPMLEEALRRAQIPAYFSRGTARPDPGGRAFLALLACAAEKCSASRFAEYLSLGQVPAAGFEAATEWVPAADEMLADVSEPEQADREADESTSVAAPASWEKLLVDAAVIGGRDRWQRRLRGLAREFELRMEALDRDDDPQREHLARRLDQLRQLETFALPLIDALSALPGKADWKEWIAELSALARVALRKPEPVLAVLAEFAPMGDVGPAGIEEVAEVLSSRLRFLRHDPPRRRYGCVFVGSIEEARGREFRVVFLPGLAEGLFPRRALEDPLLLDQFRRAPGLEALPLRDDRVAEERLRLRLAVAATGERLVASYPRMDIGEGRPRVPSFYALELPRAVEGRLPELKEFERQAREAAPARLNWPAPRETGDAIDAIEYDLVILKQSKGARYLLDTNQPLARSLRARWRRWEPKWTSVDGLITRDAEAMAALEAHRLRARAWSPSSLQQFAACPYRFALHGIYGLRPREEAASIEQMDPLTRGALFHQVQFALFGQLRKSGTLPVTPERLGEVLEVADRVLEQVAAKYEDELVPAIPRVWKSEIEDLRTDLRGWLQYVAANDAGWEPIHFEFAFGLARDQNRDPASTQEEADLSECGVRLRGSIDLIERDTARGLLRITDHKTGRAPESTPHLVGGGRFLQPLLYGLAAEKLLGQAVESGRLLFATERGGFQPIEIRLDHRARLFLGKLLSNIDGAIADGFLPPVPQKDACKACDYGMVCGPYEDQRADRYKDRRDERLEPLTEIRGMA